MKRGQAKHAVVGMRNAVMAEEQSICSNVGACCHRRRHAPHLGRGGLALVIRASGGLASMRLPLRLNAPGSALFPHFHIF